MKYFELLRSLTFGLCLLAVGCQQNSKIQQIQDGVENVDSHAQSIEDHAQISD